MPNLRLPAIVAAAALAAPAAAGAHARGPAIALDERATVGQVTASGVQASIVDGDRKLRLSVAGGVGVLAGAGGLSSLAGFSLAGVGRGTVEIGAAAALALAAVAGLVLGAPRRGRARRGHGRRRRRSRSDPDRTDPAAPTAQEESMTHPKRRRVLAAAALGALVLATGASAHAVMSPPVAKAKELQQFSLSVPTEKEGASTTRIELTVPDGFSIDSFEAAPGWKRRVQAQGAGEDAVVQKVTWTGGSVPTGEDAVFRFNGSAAGSKTYLFDVRQTYSDGSIVDWSAPSESSDAPAPRVRAVSSFASGGTPTLTVVALVVAALGLVVGGTALLARGGRDVA